MRESTVDRGRRRVRLRQPIKFNQQVLKWFFLSHTVFKLVVDFPGQNTQSLINRGQNIAESKYHMAKIPSGQNTTRKTL